MREESKDGKRDDLHFDTRQKNFATLCDRVKRNIEEMWMQGMPATVIYGVPNTLGLHCCAFPFDLLVLVQNVETILLTQ